MDLSERGSAAARHPWEVVRAEFFRDLIAANVDLTRVRDVVDVGAGDGWFAQELVPMLDDAAHVTCWDINYSSDDLVADLPAGVLRTASRPSNRAELVTLLDVIEHVPDDRSFLRDQVAPLLADDGRLIVSVPAHPGLYSQHDAALHHERRYARRQFLSRLGEVFTVVESGSLFTSLLAPRVVEVVAEKDVDTYRRTAQRLGVAAHEIVMVGNSVRSDILPVLEIGGHAVFVPHEHGWALEHAELPDHPRLRRAERFMDVPAILAAL